MFDSDRDIKNTTVASERKGLNKSGQQHKLPGRAMCQTDGVDIGIRGWLGCVISLHSKDVCTCASHKARFEGTAGYSSFSRTKVLLVL